MDPFNLEGLPSELQCYTVSQVTDLVTVLRLFQTSQSFRALAGDCITILRSDQERVVTVDELIKFPKLQVLDNIIVHLTSRDDLDKLNQFNNLRDVVFLVDSKERPLFTDDYLISTYLTQHCRELQRVEFMVFNTILSLSRQDLNNKNWMATSFGSSHVDLSSSLRILTRCTGLDTVWIPQGEQHDLWLRQLNLKLLSYEIPTGINVPIYVTDKVINFLRQAYLGPTDPNSPPVQHYLKLVDTKITNSIILMNLTYIYALVNNLVDPANLRFMFVTPLMKTWFPDQLSTVDRVEISSFVRYLSETPRYLTTYQSFKLKDPRIISDLARDRKIVTNIFATYRQLLRSPV